MPPTAPTTIVIVRHGETKWNVEVRFQGHLDSPLTRVGLAQARALTRALTVLGSGAGRSFDALYSSDLGRALTTATMIAERLHLTVQTDPRLRERDLGDLQGLTLAEFQTRFPDEYDRYHTPDPDRPVPGGESIRQRHQRALAAAADLLARHPGGRILIVTHGGVLDSFFRLAMDLSLTYPRHWSLFNAGINVLTVRDGRWRIETWGDVSHLRQTQSLDDL